MYKFRQKIRRNEIIEITENVDSLGSPYNIWRDVVFIHYVSKGSSKWTIIIDIYFYVRRFFENRVRLRARGYDNLLEHAVERERGKVCAMSIMSIPNIRKQSAILCAGIVLTVIDDFLCFKTFKINVQYASLTSSQVKHVGRLLFTCGRRVK